MNKNQQVPVSLLWVLLTLYFAQGLPSGFITQALPAILREYHVSLEMIGLSGILLIPWALKFLWAPIVDKYYSHYWGRSRSWIIPLQLLSALIVAVVALFDPYQLSSAQTLWSMYALLFLLSLIGATHDVAADGLATRSLPLLKPSFQVSDKNLASGDNSQNHNSDFNYRHQQTVKTYAQQPHRHSMGANDDFVEVSQSLASQRLSAEKSQLDKAPLSYRGAGNAVQVIGYRLGLIVGGGVFLMILGQWSWRYSFFAMSGLILLNTVPIYLFRESKNKDTPSRQGTAKATDSQSVHQYLLEQYGYFWQNKQMRAWLAVLLTFKIADGVSSGMVKPMMVDMGISTVSIGLWASVLGSVASLLGAAIAAWLLQKIAQHKALMLFYLLQVITTGLYAIVAIGYEYPSWLGLVQAGDTAPFWWAYAANAIEHMAAALALVAMLTMVMHYARHDKAGSDFTTQVCLLTVFSGGSHLLSGFIAGKVGYTAHFALSVAIGLLCVLPLVYWQRFYQQW